MAKKNTHTPAKADIDFENELWNAANELRGAVAENQYKDYVLSLLFVKHLSERYEVRKQEIQLSFLDPKSDYYSLEANEQTKVLEDDLEADLRTQVAGLINLFSKAKFCENSQLLAIAA